MPKIRLLHVWVTIRDSWSRQGAGNAKNWLLLVLGQDREFLLATEFFLVLCRDKNLCVVTWFQILNHKNFRNMAFLVATGVLVLCCDDVATEVFLS